MYPLNGRAPPPHKRKDACQGSKLVAGVPLPGENRIPLAGIEVVRLVWPNVVRPVLAGQGVHSRDGSSADHWETVSARQTVRRGDLQRIRRLSSGTQA